MPKKHFKAIMRKTKLGARYTDDPDFRVMFTATLSFAFNIIYALYNQILGSLSGELWFMVLSGYYMILGAMRIGVVITGKRSGLAEAKNASDNDRSVMSFCGILLIALALEFAASAFLSFTYDIATEYDKLLIYSVVIYTAVRMTFALRNMIRAHKSRSVLLSVMRDISCADAAASVFTLLRSLMIYKYVEMHHLVTKIVAVVVFLFVMGLGANMLFKVHKERKRLKEEKE